MKAKLQAVQPVLAAKDVTASIRFFGRLGFAVIFEDSPVASKYAVVRRDDVELHIQWAAAEEWAYPNDRPVYRIMVSDVDALYEEFLGAGGIEAAASHASPWARPANTPWKTREFHLRDPSQNGLQFYRPVDSRG